MSWGKTNHCLTNYGLWLQVRRVLGFLLQWDVGKGEVCEPSHVAGTSLSLGVNTVPNQWHLPVSCTSLWRHQTRGLLPRLGATVCLSCCVRPAAAQQIALFFLSLSSFLFLSLPSQLPPTLPNGLCLFKTSLSFGAISAIL